MDQITRYKTESGAEVVLSNQIIKDQITGGNDKVTDAEVANFIQLCQAQRLNPFLGEAYLVKYGDKPATIITGKEVFTKRAYEHPQFDGFEAGITVVNRDGDMIQRPGSMYGKKTEKLVGGWARVWCKDRKVPFFDEVGLEEYDTGHGNWSRMPGTMIRKVALVHALREAFPESFQGLYSAEEMGQVEVRDVTPHDPEPVEVPAEPEPEQRPDDGEEF